jgi:HlyD family secretion protein
MNKRPNFRIKNNRPAYALAFLVLLAAVAAYWFYSHANPTDNPQNKDAQVNTATKPKTTLTVSAVKPSPARLAMNIPATGNIAAWQEAVIGAEVNGLLLKEVLVNVGDVVKKGQVIARFSRSTIDADIAQATANLADAHATALEAAGNAERARSIQDTGALSKQQIQQYLMNEASTKARVDAAKAALTVQQVKLNQTVVTAPDDGVISARTATVGSVASAGQELFKLIRQGRLEWRAELTSADVSQLKVGMPATLTLPDGKTVDGKLRMLSPNVDTQSRNAMAYVDLLRGAAAKAGMFARGEFTLADSDALTLPNSAIVMRDGFAYVMQVMPNQTVKQVKVTLGRRNGNTVEVLDLQAPVGEYVNSGGAFLVDGDLVKVVAASTEETIPKQVDAKKAGD